MTIAVGVRRILACVSLLHAAAGLAQPAEETGEAAARSVRANDPVYAFYDLMEPLWNAPPGISRDGEACGVMAEIRTRVRAMAVRPTPENAAMLRSAASIEEACAAGQAQRVDQEIDRLSHLFYRSRISRMINR